MDRTSQVKYLPGILFWTGFSNKVRENYRLITWNFVLAPSTSICSGTGELIVYGSTNLLVLPGSTGSSKFIVNIFFILHLLIMSVIPGMLDSLDFILFIRLAEAD